MKIKHDDFCPCTRFRAQAEFCSCGAIKRDEIVKGVSESFAKRLHDIMRGPSARSAPSFDPLLGSGGLPLEQGE